LKQIEDEVFVAGYSQVVLRQLLDLFPRLFFVGLVDEEVQGYISGGLGHPPEEAWLLSLAVTNAARGTGLVTTLVNALIDALGRTEASVLKLTVDPAREDVVGFYERLGFVMEASEDTYFGPGHPRALLSRYLTPSD
jgi:[ribosomal protein S18]-alanine N-acetyltransferase